MISADSKLFIELRQYIQSIPIIDTHDHSYQYEPQYSDPLHVFLGSYYEQDLVTVLGVEKVLFLKDETIPFDKRWAVFEPGWKKSCHTGYARAIRRLLKKFYQIEEVTCENLESLPGRLLDLTDPALFESILEDANIRLRLQDLGHIPESEKIIHGRHDLTPRSRLVIPLPRYHRITAVEEIRALFPDSANTITSLDDYLHTCHTLFTRYKNFGAVAFKDQSAYTRTLHYENPSRDSAESLFNRILSNPRARLAYPDSSKPLDDFLFHEFIRMAAAFDLPVQIHTGHMAAVSNEITKANAAKLTSLLEIHRDVHFDLLHANWPCSGELLYLVKNFPNVNMNFCWANIIDPYYCIELFKQALSCVPHGKVHAHGSDFCSMVDRAWAHADIARDNIAFALAQMTEMHYLTIKQARSVARDWLYNNPNRFYNLKQPPI